MMLTGRGHVKCLWQFRRELMGILSPSTLDLGDILGHLHSWSVTHYDYMRNCVSGPSQSASVSISCYQAIFLSLTPSHSTGSADLPWLNYSTPSLSLLGVFLFSHQNRCTLLEEEELTGAGDEPECSSDMCQQHYTNAAHDSSTSWLLEKPVGLKSCFWVNKCWNAKGAQWIS